MRGEPDVLLGDRGGALPAGNMEGKELPEIACGLDEFPGTFKGPPALASLISDVTCIQKFRKQDKIRICIRHWPCKKKIHNKHALAGN